MSLLPGQFLRGRPVLQMTSRVRRSIGVVTAVVALLGAGSLLGAIAQVGRIVPGTHVLGVDVGGQSIAAARRMISAEVTRFERRPLPVAAPGGRLLIDADEVGVTVDVDATLREAFARGRRGPLDRLWRPFIALLDREVLPSAVLDETALADRLERAAAEVERAAYPGDLRLDAAQRRVRVISPQGQVDVDREQSLARLRRAFLDPSTNHAALVTTSAPPPTDRTAIETLAERVRRALRVPLVLEHEGRRVTVDGDALARMLTIGATADGERMSPTIVLPVEKVDAALGVTARRVFERSPQDAVLEITEPTVTLDALGSTRFRPLPIDASVTPSVDRTVFVPRRTAAQLERMIAGGITRETADLLVIDAAFSTADAVERQPTHVIGTFTTRFAAGGPRTVNIALLAEMIDGTPIAPGAEFSINRASGPRSCTVGFLEAGTIVRGELVETCGGGVSQLGTTLLNAAFFAGLPLTEWQPHSFFISRYPAGREATLSYPELDVRFLNDTDGWILLRATTSPTSVTVTLLGRPRWSEVGAEHGTWGPPTPFTELVRTAPDLAPGRRRIVQSGGDGFALTVSRRRIPADGTAAPEVERWRTVYRPQQRIVEISPADAPDAAAPPEAGAGASDR